MSISDIKKDDSEYVEEIWEDEEQRAAEEKALVRKIDLRLLPCIWIMYLLSYMDRTNIGNARIAGMEADMQLTSNQYSIILVVFFVTYVVFEVPSNLILARTRPSIFLPTIMVLWGAVTCCMAAADNYRHLIALRLIVGMLEAGFAPGVMLMLGSWYRKDEMSLRFAVYISAAVLSGAFGGILAGAITSGLEGAHGIRGWQWLFIVEGAATVGFAIIAHFILLDFPATSSQLSARERALAVSRLRTSTSAPTEDTPRLSPVAAIKVSLRNWRTWLLTFGYMVIVGSSTLSYFYPTLVAGLGYSSQMAQYMTVPIYAVAFVAVACSGYFADKIPSYRAAVIAAWLGLSLVCSICVCVVYNFTARYVLLIFMAAGLWAANGVSLSYAGATFADMTTEVRGVSLAFVNAMGNLAQIYGAYLFPADDSPKYLMGFGVISGMCGFGVAVYITGFICINRWPTKRTAA